MSILLDFEDVIWRGNACDAGHPREPSAACDEVGPARLPEPKRDATHTASSLNRAEGWAIRGASDMGATKDIIEKVVKLLALASGRGTTPEEAATAAAAAQRLMLRHRIEQTEVERLEVDDAIGFTSPSADAGEGSEGGFVYQTQRWQLDLLKVIAAANGCMTVITRKDRSGKWMELVGRRSDLEIARYLWAYLSREIERLKAEQTRGWSRARKSHFCLGAVHTIADALRRETVAASSADGLTSGAMVVSSRFEAARAWYFERQPGARFVRSRRTHVDAQSYQAGKAAGAGVSIRQGMSTTTDQRRLLT